MRRSRFEVYRREDGQYDWRLLAANGRIIGTSGGQGYRDERDARRAIEAVWQAAYNASLDARSVAS